jgi:hypothetical protein
MPGTGTNEEISTGDKMNSCLANQDDMPALHTLFSMLLCKSSLLLAPVCSKPNFSDATLANHSDRGPNGAHAELLLTATAQNLRRMAKKLLLPKQDTDPVMS